MCVGVCVWVCVYWQFGAVGIGGSDPGLGLAVVTLSKSLYPNCFSQPICKTGTWPCAGVDMTIDRENIAVACVSSPGLNHSLPMVNAPAVTGPAVVGLFLC